MERTAKREDFFAAVRTDPYLATIHAHARQMWTEGYAQALRDLARAGCIGNEDAYHFGNHYEIDRRAEAWLTAQTNRNAEMMVAWAEMAKMAKVSDLDVRL